MLIGRVRGWLRALLRPDIVEREMREEMQLHLDRAAERLMARGVPAAEARAEARCEFGNVPALQEEARDALHFRLIDDLRVDIRYGWRALRRAPAFAAVAVLS